MEHSLYKLPRSIYIPVLQEPDQQVAWSENRFEKNTILLYLQNFDLTEEHLSAHAAETIQAAPSMWAQAVVRGDKHYKIWNQAKEEFEKTRRIEGSLFLTPCFQKIWFSHYDVEYLIKVS